MTLYLRDKENNTLLDLEVWIKKENNNSFIELSSSINIKNYSNLLLNILNIESKIEFINEFDNLSELRGWLWEKFFMAKKNKPEEYNNVIKELKLILKKVADKFNLFIIQD